MSSNGIFLFRLVSAYLIKRTKLDPNLYPIQSLFINLIEDDENHQLCEPETMPTHVSCLTTNTTRPMKDVPHLTMGKAHPMKDVASLKDISHLMMGKAHSTTGMGTV